MLQFEDAWEEFYRKESKEMRLCQSDQSLCVVQMTGHNPNQTNKPTIPLQKNSPMRVSSLKAVLKVKLVPVITVPFVSYLWGKKLFYTYVVKPLSRLQWCTAKFSKKYPLFPQMILVFIVNFDGKSISVNRWLPCKGGTRKLENMVLTTYMNQFPFLQSRLEGMEERNDSISSQEECQDLGYTKGK